MAFAIYKDVFMITHYIEKEHGCQNHSASSLYCKLECKIGIYMKIKGIAGCGCSDEDSFNEFLNINAGKLTSSFFDKDGNTPTIFKYRRAIICVACNGDKFIKQSPFIQEEMDL